MRLHVANRSLKIIYIGIVHNVLNNFVIEDSLNGWTVKVAASGKSSLKGWNLQFSLLY